MLDPDNLSWISLALAVIAGLALAASGGRPYQIGRPTVLVGLMCIATVTFGSWSYYATNQFFPKFHAPINRALLYSALGIASAAVASFAVQRRAPARIHPARWRWTGPALDLMIVLLTSLAVLGTLASFTRIGYIPMLRGDIRQERLYYAAQAGVFFRLSLIGTASAVLAGIRWLAIGRSRFALLAVVIGLACTSLYGPRFFPFVAVGVLIICYDLHVKRISTARVALAVGALAALGLAGAIRRERANTFVFDQPGVELDLRTAALAVGYVSVPEFRDYAWSLSYFDDPAHRLHGKTLAGAIVPLLPSAVWRVVGVDKEALYSRDSATLMAEILKVDTGIRIGIMGELHMNFGLTGIAVGMLVFGALIGWLDRQLRASHLLDPVLPLLALTALVSVFAIIGILGMFASSIVLFGWPLALAALLGARRTIELPGALAPVAQAP